jgi:hypothetical protein
MCGDEAAYEWRGTGPNETMIARIWADAEALLGGVKP